MNANIAPNCGDFQRKIACPLAAVGLVVAIVASPALAQTPGGIALDRIVSEIRELKRLVFLLKQDERKARTERAQVEKYRGNALRFANGGRHVLHIAGFVALVQKCEQSPGQASMLQMYVHAIEADNFVPEPEESFAGGDVSQLVQFCRQKNLGVRYGSRAQLVIAELTRDLVRQADAQIADLDERIEHYKAQNIAHTDLIGKLMLCARHCYGCPCCYHYGYGCCGSVPAMVFDHPIAGLNSAAYDTSHTPKSESLSRSGTVATDHRRLKFLTPDEPTRAAQPAANQIAGNQGSTKDPKSDGASMK